MRGTMANDRFTSAPHRTGRADFPHPALLKALASSMHRLAPELEFLFGLLAQLLSQRKECRRQVRSFPGLRQRLRPFRFLRSGIISIQSALCSSDSACFQYGPLAPSRLDRDFAATMGRSEPQTGTPRSYVFPSRCRLPLSPACLPGPLMFLIGLSDRAALFDPGRPAAC